MPPMTRLDYDYAGVPLHGELASPAGPGPHPAVMVMHDALGVGEVVRRRARELAEAGYAALVTDMYGDGDAGPGEQMLRLHGDPATLRGRAAAGLKALQARPEVDAGRIAAIGYCFGGQCVLELARSGADLKAAVSFHGLLTTARPAGAGDVRARLLVLTGALDPFAPLDHVQSFQREMTDAKADWHVTVYGQGWHAFTDPDIAERTTVQGVRYDPLLDRLSWDQATSFLGAALQA